VICSLCRSERFALWSRDGTTERLCLACLLMFVEEAEHALFSDRFRSFTSEHVARGHVPSMAELLHARHAGLGTEAWCAICRGGGANVV